ncbi:MAG: PilZ domain-containing protein [Desulfopila sp.]|jgi:c-di-GMP-binding flagellar brake protein YcgR|nr:PilZ domain-containing protein [Desulfopila sp.]
MNQNNSRSKRQALRFLANDHPLSFKTEFEEGQGFFDNISGGGCAARSVTVPLQLREKVLIHFPLEKEGDRVEIGARVVRIDGDNVAFQFNYLSEKDKQRIVKYFAEKQRKAS